MPGKGVYSANDFPILCLTPSDCLCPSKGKRQHKGKEGGNKGEGLATVTVKLFFKYHPVSICRCNSTKQAVLRAWSNSHQPPKTWDPPELKGSVIRMLPLDPKSLHSSQRGVQGPPATDHPTALDSSHRASPLAFLIFKVFPDMFTNTSRF
jgi:hypothetical protein